MVGSVLQKLVLRARSIGSAPAVPRCTSLEVRSEDEIRTAALELSATMSASSPGAAAVLPSLLRDLVSLNTPSLFLNIMDSRAPIRVVLRPWEQRTLRFRGTSFLVEAASEATEGIEAYTMAPFSHVTALYPTAPDHPVYVISLEHHDEGNYTGDIPQYLTHLSIMVNGSLVAHCERLLHERGPQGWGGAARAAG
ncbi:hypothetical protein BH23GEM9_BH23GEM9_06620 [soil metagenome]